MNNDYNYYKQIDPFNHYISYLQESCCELFINNSRLCEKLSAANYDLLCRFAEDVITPMSLTITRNFAKSLERERLRQKLQDSYLISPEL